ncbi:unnamed protein product [Tuber aestivum]|uniref:B30.2/SPRY domain-containing protein n=1 Tax=Tuber aestivum TaxID=59557 RepID=A0A292PJI6_9PEZI|nr:unnamed protein product [Tuber aestivum]
MAQQKLNVSQDVEDFFSAKSAHGPPKLSGLINLLRHLLTRISKLAIVVDALDDRDHLNIKSQFEGLPSFGVQKKDVAKDIELYISHEIKRNGKLKRLSSYIKDQIVDALVKGALGICCLDQISKLRSDRAIKSALESLPPTLDETYERILCNIADEDRELALTVFRFLVCGSNRDFTLSEIREGLATEIGSKRMNPDNRLNDEEDILDICGGLVDINEKDISKASYYYIDETLGKIELAKIIYTYLLLDDFSTGPCSTIAEFDLRKREYPLFLLAAQHGWSVSASYQYGSDKVLDALLAQFYSNDNNPNFISWRQAHQSTPKDITDYLEPQRSSTATLYYASALGLWQLIKGIIGGGADVNHYGGNPPTPLQVAAATGQAKTVKALLGHGASTAPIRDSDAMMCAAGSGHADCVKLLIEAGATSHCPDRGLYGAAMHRAYTNGFEDAYNAILCSEHYRRSEDSRPFCLMIYEAASQGFGRSTEILIERYGSRIISDNNEFLPTTLRTFAEHGRTKILQRLLQKPEALEFLSRDKVFVPVLEGAVFYGQTKTVELLLRKRKDSRELGVSFHLAIAKGFPKIRDMLLREGADPCAKDEHGWTPMFYAMHSSREGSVEGLLAVLGDVEKSEIMNITGMGPGGWEAIGDDSMGLKISEDRCEVENISASKKQLRTKFPITPVVGDYYLEVHILKGGSTNSAIGFVDALCHYVCEGSTIYTSSLGWDVRSWAYHPGYIHGEDSPGARSAPNFTTGDVIGCHFDRVRSAVSFTLNGKRADTGDPLPGIRGKLHPIIRLTPGDKFRTNFGSEPFLHKIPEPAAPEAYIKVGGGWTNWFDHPYECYE